jgi:hypothetical protein
MAAASLAMFAITGVYPQLAFSLGNRVTTFGSLACVGLVASIPMPMWLRRGVYVVLLLAVFGTAGHWKQNHQIQMAVIDDMRQKLQQVEPETRVLVSGHQYGQLGSLAHVEFLSRHWQTDSIVQLVSHRQLRALSLNWRCEVRGNTLFEAEKKDTYPLDPVTVVYDSEQRRLLRLTPEELSAFVEALPREKRHWIQLIENEQINRFVINFVPRLKYAFENQ